MLGEPEDVEPDTIPDTGEEERLDDGEDEASIVEWLEANYGTQTTSNVSNDPQNGEQAPM